MTIPTTQEIEQKTKLHFDTMEIEVIEDIFFRIFGIDMILPKGLRSDGASLPKFISGFYSKFDTRWLFASIVHDYLWRTCFLPKNIGTEIFYEILKFTAGLRIALLFTYSVKIFGNGIYRKNMKNPEKFPEAKNRLKEFICKPKV